MSTIHAYFAAATLFLFFGLHGTACNMHAVAVERVWAVKPDTTKYQWSYAYCRAVGAPLRWLIP